MSARAYTGLGSNLSDREAVPGRALEALARRGFELTARSPHDWTEPAGGPTQAWHGRSRVARLEAAGQALAGA